MKRGLLLVIVWIALLMLVAGCGSTSGGNADNNTTNETAAETGNEDASFPDADGVYDGRDDVAIYLYCYHELPDNYMTKKEAESLGWEGGSLESYAPGKCIGGDYFGNYEGLLPEDEEYRECDIDTLGSDSRGAKRIIYSDDGDIYYTEDHYESFSRAEFSTQGSEITVVFTSMAGDN